MTPAPRRGSADGIDPGRHKNERVNDKKPRALILRRPRARGAPAAGVDPKPLKGQYLGEATVDRMAVEDHRTDEAEPSVRVLTAICGNLRAQRSEPTPVRATLMAVGEDPNRQRTSTITPHLPVIPDQLSPGDQPSLFDRLFARIERAAVEDAVREAEQRVADAEQARRDADEAAVAAQADLVLAMRTLSAWLAYNGVPDQGQGGGDATVARNQPPARLGTSASPTGRQSMRALLAQHDPGAEWTIPSIARMLGLDESSHDAIGQSLARMVRDGEIFRPRRGVYTKLRPPELPGSESGSGRQSQGPTPREGLGKSVSPWRAAARRPGPVVGGGKSDESAPEASVPALPRFACLVPRWRCARDLSGSRVGVTTPQRSLQRRLFYARAACARQSSRWQERRPEGMAALGGDGVQFEPYVGCGQRLSELAR